MFSAGEQKFSDISKIVLRSLISYKLYVCKILIVSFQVAVILGEPRDFENVPLTGQFDLVFDYF